MINTLRKRLRAGADDPAHLVMEEGTAMLYMSARTYFRAYDMAGTWHQYRDAMHRRRPGSALSHNAFGRNARRGVVYADLQGSALFGHLHHHEVLGEVFVVSHQAPRTHRGMVNLLRALARDRRVRCAFFVTADLVDMLVRCGFVNTGHTETSWFRGVPVTKHVVVNFI